MKDSGLDWLYILSVKTFVVNWQYRNEIVGSFELLIGHSGRNRHRGKGVTEEKPRSVDFNIYPLG